MTDSDNNIILRPLRNDEIILFDLCFRFCERVTSSNAKKMLNFLLRRRSPRRFDINSINAHGKTALSYMLERLKLTGLNERILSLSLLQETIYIMVLKLLMNNGASVHVQIPCKLGWPSTMLLNACESNTPSKVVLSLLERGANVNDMDKFNRTPLHFASRCANFETMSLLINCGADINCRDIYGDSPVTLLMETFGRVFYGFRATGKILRVLYNVTSEEKLLCIENCLDLLLRHGGNINDIGECSASSLFLAINGIGLRPELQIVPFLTKLLSEGADVNIGFTNEQDLHFVTNDSSDVVIYVSGDTPLHAAARLGKLDVVKLLLLYNPDINRGNSSGQTAFDYACFKNYNDVQNEILFHTRKNLYSYYTSL
jgi:hypothetical protein